MFARYPPHGEDGDAANDDEDCDGDDKEDDEDDIAKVVFGIKWFRLQTICLSPELFGKCIYYTITTDKNISLELLD